MIPPILDLQMLVCDAIANSPRIAGDLLERTYVDTVPQDLRSGLRALMRQPTDDPLEPFFLSDDSADLSEVIVGILFASGVPRCRVVGDASQTTEGGLVVSRTLKSHLVFQSSFRRPRTCKTPYWLAIGLAKRNKHRFLLDGGVTRAGDGGSSQQACSRPTSNSTAFKEHGGDFKVAVECNLGGFPGVLSASLVDTGTSVSSLGWSMTFEGDHLVFKGLRPEATIRLLAACMKSEMVACQIQSEKTRYDILIQLVPPDGEVVTAQIICIAATPHPIRGFFGLADIQPRVCLDADIRNEMMKSMIVPEMYMKEVAP